jgi:hypothetical protein
MSDMKTPLIQSAGTSDRIHKKSIQRADTRVEQPQTLHSNTHTSPFFKLIHSVKGWIKTLINVAMLEALPHLAGGGTTLLNNIGNTKELATLAIALNVGMWILMYGPNTKRNVDYLEESDASINITSKLVHQITKHMKKDEKTRRKWAKIGHWGDLTIWEVIYIVEAIGIGWHFGIDTGLKYWGGAAAFGLAKNLGITFAFEARKLHLYTKSVGFRKVYNDYKQSSRHYIHLKEKITARKPKSPYGIHKPFKFH